MQNPFRFVLSSPLVTLRGLLPLCLALASPCSSSAQERLPYQNAKLPLEERVRDLLQRMTLEEKIAQLQSSWQNAEYVKNKAQLFVSPNREFVPEKAEIALKNGVGEVSDPSEKRGPREMAEFTNAVQSWVVRNTRLGIPVLFHDECLHGHLAPRGTNYPVPIALASTWDPDLVFNIFSSVAREVRARGAQHCLAPVLDLARDPRWGRTEETYGEDPLLVSRMGVAAIHGLQGDSPGIGKSHVLATAKHFAVHGQPEGGTNMAPGNYSERVIRESFLKPFESAVRKGKVQSVMASYNEIDGIPSHANHHLLTDILRNEWMFNGIVVSDYFGVTFLNSLHHVAASDGDAAKQALEAVVDLELQFGDAYASLAELVRQKTIPEAL